MIAELFQTTVPNVNLHLKNIYDQAELSAEATIKDFLIVRQEGERRSNTNCLKSGGEKNEDAADAEIVKALEDAAKKLPVGKNRQSAKED